MSQREPTRRCKMHFIDLLSPCAHYALDKTPLFDIPNIREYFLDLEKVLAVICDGPTKSFAFRRLNYLASKFTMYSSLNEQQELAEMKGVPHRYDIFRRHFAGPYNIVTQ